MAAIKKKKTSKASVADWAWLDERFNKLENDHKAILSKLGSGFVSDKLATQIRLARGIGLTIDRKVPDKQVPPKPNRKEK